jgi:glycerophosphoryl diester phosphodiesterase
MVEAPHPESVVRGPGGRQVQLKAHMALWSGQHPPNSLPAIVECYRAHVARAEIDIAMLDDADFLVVHDLDLADSTNGSGRADQTTRRQAEQLRLLHAGGVSQERPPLLSEVVAAIVDEPFPTLLELDLKDWRPWPWPRVEELVQLVQPVKNRVIFGGGCDWNLRRLLRVDPTLGVGFTITEYLDWVPPGEKWDTYPGVLGAYGYLDAHPLARERNGPVPDYLRDRLGGILRLVPGARETHIRLYAVEHMLDDGLDDLAEFVHGLGLLLDVWTLDAGSPNWQARLGRALAAGADVITTNTPRTLAHAAG